MAHDKVLELARQNGLLADPLTQLIREGARELVHRAVQLEFQSLLSLYEDDVDETGRARVVRNGYHPERKIQTGIGPVCVKVPKVRTRSGAPVTFHSALVPPYVRKAKSLEAELPWLYLKGVSSGEMDDALKVLVGPDAEGLSASTVSRLKKEWKGQYEQWRQSRLDQDEWVYIWVDGIYSGLRAEDVKLCTLVVIGVNALGQKKFLAIEDGVRESTQSWREVLVKLKKRGMNVPKLAVGDGAMGFWAALDEVFGQTRHQRCWVHKTNNIVGYLPKSLQDKARACVKDIWMAPTKAKAEVAFDLFVEQFEGKYPRAVECLLKDQHDLLAFYDFPQRHWQSIRTSNPIESTFATIRHRTKRSKGCLNRDGMLHMMFKLSQCAQGSWRKLRGFADLGKVITGINFKDGIEQPEPEQKAA
ncbi:IS256 family transposase [Pseudovibrio sp. Tun.PSC04-5.I4]|uniref:IS256 family transposase n=1 Tax=Pseudovibrio sp. Tun.PSC04-5.I4 TaxID=1798213 RepID=UPI00088E81B9|nr:IS256 family transposase [Pseudovibrio sp. Tun.PSC04-5.I4]SDR46843.1 Transposase (or an inactivated derivative) [Pseudovibrio sp. Tun.PSC04-5.I4]